MVVQPGFLDHWKTKMLIELTTDDAAPLMMIRLWGYCQQQRKWQFENLADSKLKGIVHGKVLGSEVRAVLIESGFIRMEGTTTIVHDWNVVNKSLITSWNNGGKGGRPGNPETRGLSAGYRRDTRGKPTPSNHSTLSTDKKGRDTRGIPVGFSVTDEDNRDPKAMQKLSRLCSEISGKLKSGEKLDQ